MNPEIHLNKIIKDYPRLNQKVNMFRAGKGKEYPDWPNWCFLPIAAWIAIITESHKTNTLSLSLSDIVGKLAALATWRYSKGIYRIGDELSESLLDCEITGDLPADIFYRLPEWCIYIEAPGLKWFDKNASGFFCHLEWDANTGESELRLLIVLDNDLINFPIHIGSFTIIEAINKTIDFINMNAEKKGFYLSIDHSHSKVYAKQLTPYLSTILYLCSIEPDISDKVFFQGSPSYPKAVKTKTGLNFFPAEKTRVFDVGLEYGKYIRESRALYNPSDSKVRPHLRRAHWHGYWHGPKTQMREFCLKWIPPIFVGT